MANPPGVRISGPLKPFLPGLEDELLRLGYASTSSRNTLRLVAHLSRWLAASGVALAALTPETAERFLQARRAAGYTGLLTVRSLAPVFGYLRTLGVVPVAGAPAAEGPVEELLCRYRSYLESERGLSEASVRSYSAQVRPFLEGCVQLDVAELDRVDAACIHAFVRERVRHQRQGSMKVTVKALRSLLGFLHVTGMIERPLAGAVPSVAAWRLASLPKWLSAAEVERLLASCDRSTSTGRRDFAIITSLVRLGLRRSELASLSLENIDWQLGELVVVGKEARSERLPLPADVGEAIAAYLHRDRPSTAQGRSVFVRVKAPHGPLSPSGIHSVVRAAGLRASLGPIGAHQLRHTAASAMLRGGASLCDVGQVLRHRSVLSTAIYAKVDERALRSLARPWPGGAS